MSGTTLRGSCHCANLSLEIGLSRPPHSYQPRACDCDFCRQHAASYLSDAAGSLRIKVRDPAALGRYRQGSGTAEFLFCRGCGVLIGVVYEEAGRTYAALNSRVVEGAPAFGETLAASPKTLPIGERVQRWKQLWFADVQLLAEAPGARP
ncbi:GFA family protein [Pseudomonas panipatensis]|uniref:CENP-V/GFA domain-containing protein n=1 Tax=Pseudomonas panipatensis TaxID=428992 RepID=A0A1G8FE66_9PSED|nr:aldehyde-activating protein [Pseudomonas panipatensis]SDH80289.1 hypothetical protein SAMN05216272_103186 [Pseudomonas panipatensis]SMP54340.1 hypothetical protein SAMN06295951_103273 [Pseudomonas panipatensis]